MLDTLKPGIFHGRRKKKDFFEGWYFKMVDRSEKNAYAVIPGVSIARNPLKSHAFIMFMDAEHSECAISSIRSTTLRRTIKSSSLPLVDLRSALMG
jgi:hypothetical protein